MTRIPPGGPPVIPQGLLSAQSSKQGQGALPLRTVTAEVLELPPALQSLSKALIDKGVIGGKQGKNTIIQLPQGDVIVKGGLPFPPGTDISIRLPFPNTESQGLQKILIQPVISNNAGQGGEQDSDTPVQTGRAGEASSLPVPRPAISDTESLQQVKSLQQTLKAALTSRAEGAVRLLTSGDFLRLTLVDGEAQQNLVPFRGTQGQGAIQPPIVLTASSSLLQSTALQSTNTVSVLTQGLSGEFSGAGEGKPLQFPFSGAQTAVASASSANAQSGQIPFQNTASALGGGERNVITGQNTKPLQIDANTLRGLQQTAALPVRDVQVVSVTQNTPGLKETVEVLSTLPLASGQIVAHVTDRMTPQGQPIVRLLPLQQLYALNYPAQAVTPGTVIVVEPISNAAIHQTQAHLIPWGEMNDLAHLFAATSSPQMMAGFQAGLPTPSQPQLFPAAAILFLAAANAGDLSPWFGAILTPQLQNFNADHKRMVEALLDKVTKTAGGAGMDTASAPQAVSGNPADWRGFMLPFLMQGEIYKLPVWVKHYDDDEDSVESIKATRFIIDLELSKMGQVQMDGVSRPALKNLNLTLKTQQPLRDYMKQEVEALWINALDGLGMNGRLRFDTL